MEGSYSRGFTVPAVCEAVQFSLQLQQVVKVPLTVLHVPLHYLLKQQQVNEHSMTD